MVPELHGNQLFTDALMYMAANLLSLVFFVCFVFVISRKTLTF